MPPQYLLGIMQPQDLAMILGVAAGGAFLLSPVMVVRMIIQHRERLAAMKNRQEGAPGIVEDIAALRRELAEVRETTTHYDLSFDAALSRVETRLDRMDGARQTEAPRAATYPFPPTQSSQENEIEQRLNARR